MLSYITASIGVIEVKDLCDKMHASHGVPVINSSQIFSLDLEICERSRRFVTQWFYKCIQIKTHHFEHLTEASNAIFIMSFLQKINLSSFYTPSNKKSCIT